MSRAERQWRLISGLVLAAYLLQHLLGLWPGILSFEAMEDFRGLQRLLWRSSPGTAALYLALLSHLLLGLMSLYRRRSLRMPVWEALQLALGLCIPFLLVGHLLGTRGVDVLFGVDTPYTFVVNVLWNNEWYRYRQITLLLAVWLHVVIGLHYWLRLRAGYGRWFPLAYGVALVVPVLALAGFVRAGVETTQWSDDSPRRMQVAAIARDIGQPGIDTVNRGINIALWSLGGLYLGVLGLRGVNRWRARRGDVHVHHPARARLRLAPGQSVLDTLRSHGVPHASVCGGRARCTTCRVRVGDGAGRLPAPASAEQAALERIGAPVNVRLACQLRPVDDIHITPLLPPDTGMVRRGGVAGREQQVVAMFVDLRGSTALGEAKLPYDVVFVLNRFFAEMSEALDASRGHYAQFAGDGLLALYGLEGDVDGACRDALAGAVDMGRRLDRLSAHLREELAAPLRIGIGLHVGEAIVGTMGPPSSPNLSAVGDNINVAARLESLTKDYGCALVVSAPVLEIAGVDAAGLRPHAAEVRGREAGIAVFAVDDLEELSRRLETLP